MAADIASDNERDDTHFWIDCPGCGFGGRIGVPLDYPAEVVVCSKCRQVVRVRPQDRVLWQPVDAMQFLRQRFPSNDWDAIDERAIQVEKATAQCEPCVDEAFPPLITSTRTTKRKQKPRRACSTTTWCKRR